MAKEVELDGVKMSIIAFDHLVEVKQNSDRPRDLADADELLRVKGRR